MAEKKVSEYMLYIKTFIIVKCIAAMTLGKRC